MSFELIVDTGWHGFFVIFLRIGSMISVMPAFGSVSISPRIKIFLAISISLVFSFYIELESNALSFKLVVMEILLGLIIGASVRLFVFSVQTAGSMIAQSTSLSQIFGTASSEPMPAIGHILVSASLCLFFIADLHIYWLQSIAKYYELFPIGFSISLMDAVYWWLFRVSEFFSLAFQVALPFLALSMLYYTVMGVINKAMPQLMVAFIGAPMISFLGLVILALASPTILEVWKLSITAFLVNSFEVP